MTGEKRYLTPDEHANRLGDSLRLALEIADEAARADIEGNCVSHTDCGHLWWYARAPIDPRDQYVSKTVDRAVRYLDLRNRIVHHETVPVLVRFREVKP